MNTFKAVSKAFDQPLHVPSYSAKGGLLLVLVSLLSLTPILIYVSVVLTVVAFYLVFIFKYVPNFSSDFSSVYLVFYLFVLVLFASILVFLLRPFFSASAKMKDVYLDREKEPGIYQCTDALSAALDLPPISRICVSSDVIVDVFYESISHYRHDQPTLKIGLPLVPMLETKEFLALVAHEYGHMATPKLKKSYFAIRTLRSWFHKVTHNEDGWDEKLRDASEDNHFLKVLMVPVHMGIAIVNRLFEGFSNLLELVSTPVIHDLAFFCDSIQTSILGSDNFEPMIKKLARIDQAYHASLEKILSKDLVPENMASLIHSTYFDNIVPADQFIEMTRSEDFNSWHLLPPPDIRAKHVANSAAMPGLNMSGDFVNIFSGADSFGEVVSANFYEKHHVTEEVQKSLKPNDTPISMDKYSRILSRFTSGLFRRDVVWLFPEVDKFTYLPEEKVIPFLNKVIVSIRHNIPDFSKYVEFVEDYQKQVKLFHFYQWLIKDGSKNRPDIEEIEKVKFNIKEFEKSHSKTVELYQKFYGVRIAAATALGKQSKAFKSASLLISMLTKIGAQQASVNDAITKCSTLERLIARRADKQMNHQKTISRLTRMVLKVIGDLENLLGSLPDSLISEYVDVDIDSKKLNLDQLNGEDYEHLVVIRFKELLRYYQGYNIAVSAKLAQFVESVEKKRNIEPVVTVSVKNH